MSNFKSNIAYAKALKDLSLENNIDINQIVSELQLVNSYFDDEFIGFLKNPRISKDNKKEVFKNTFTNLNKYVFSSLLVLVDNNMITNLSDIIVELKELINEEQGIVTVEVETAQELSEIDILKIKQFLFLKLNKKINIIIKLNKNLVGGFIIKYQGKTIDGSLLTKQESLKEYLKK